MSNDSKLKNYNAVMIMKEEKSSDINPRRRAPTHLQSLEFQQDDLFKAFKDGDLNYIYPFDEETLKKRDQFLTKTFQLGFTGVFTLGAANLLFFKQIKPNSHYSAVVKTILFAVSNLIPITVLTYQGFHMYNDANNFLYNKYLKDNIELYKAEKERLSI